MKRLLTITAIFEGITGLTLLSVPSLFVMILLGEKLVEPAGIMISRLAGAALLSLSIIYWFYRKVPDSLLIVRAMLIYNVAASALLVYAFSIGLSGSGLWPAVLLHIGLALWCIQSLKK
jgi:hypothetical protein